LTSLIIVGIDLDLHLLAGGLIYPLGYAGTWWSSLVTVLADLLVCSRGGVLYFPHLKFMAVLQVSMISAQSVEGFVIE
jgi:hypothetical protein